LKKFTKLDYKKFHPAGNIGAKLKTASDVMLKNDKIPFVFDNTIMRKAIKQLNLKKLGFLVVINKDKELKGVFTDGDLKRLLNKRQVFKNSIIKKYITKNPYTVNQDYLVTNILKQMNRRKITNVCVHDKENKKKIIGVIHIHNLLNLIK
jgi:arabinose-5-phosphate isomerase